MTLRRVLYYLLLNSLCLGVYMRPISVTSLSVSLSPQFHHDYLQLLKNTSSEELSRIVKNLSLPYLNQLICLTDRNPEDSYLTAMLYWALCCHYLEDARSCSLGRWHPLAIDNMICAEWYAKKMNFYFQESRRSCDLRGDASSNATPVSIAENNSLSHSNVSAEAGQPPSKSASTLRVNNPYTWIWRSVNDSLADEDCPRADSNGRPAP